MNVLYKIVTIAVFACYTPSSVFSQIEKPLENGQTDELTKAFHAGRRQALRELMPENSVAMIFSYPEQVFSKDVNYVYHPNPDLYYFSGYKEPNALLLIFKDMQVDGDSSYNELFFVQHRDAAAEQWTGRRLGVEGVKSLLGVKRVYNGETFGGFPIDLKRFNLLFDALPDTVEEDAAGSLKSLVRNFVRKGSVKPMDKGLAGILGMIYQYGNAINLTRMVSYIRPLLNREVYKSDPWIQELIAKPDSLTLQDIKQKYRAVQTGTIAFNNFTNALRGIKTPEELVLLKKSVTISSLAHTEAMRAVQPKISERELEGIMLYVHKRYGAETEGYPPIIGAGSNGCILHYEDNNAAHLNNQLVLMDVGSEYHGYSADVTRTFPANGKFTAEQKSIYQIVYEAQEKVFPLCRQGMQYDSLQAKAAEVIAAGLTALGLIKEPAEVYQYYPHGVSHHLGLDVHDKGEVGMLRANMVITVEPGIYIPAGSPCDKKWWNIGVRIEDDVVVGKNGCTLLSEDAPRKWQDIEKTIAEKSFFDAARFPDLK